MGAVGDDVPGAGARGRSGRVCAAPVSDGAVVGRRDGATAPRPVAEPSGGRVGVGADQVGLRVVEPHRRQDATVGQRAVHDQLVGLQ